MLKIAPATVKISAIAPAVTTHTVETAAMTDLTDLIKALKVLHEGLQDLNKTLEGGK